MQRPRPGDWAHRFEYWLRRASARNTLSTAGFRWTVHSANMVKTVRSLERSDPLRGAFFRDASEADVFLDIGANFGVWTIPAAAGAPRLGNVIAIEPAPGPYWCLLKNLRLNRAGWTLRRSRPCSGRPSVNPNNDRAWYGLGMLHARHGRHRDAAAALSEAGRVQPVNGMTWYALGMAWQHCNEPDKVAAVIEHTLTHDPQTAQRLIRDTERGDYAHRLG